MKYCHLQHYGLTSVQFSHSVMSDSLGPHESQHARPPCPSPTPGVHSHSRPSSQWCHPAMSSSVIPFSSCSRSLPASESFPMSQLFAWGWLYILHIYVLISHPNWTPNTLLIKTHCLRGKQLPCITRGLFTHVMICDLFRKKENKKHGEPLL